MTKSRFDSRLEDYEDPDEDVMREFWERRRQAKAHQAALPTDGSDGLGEEPPETRQSRQ